MIIYLKNISNPAAEARKVQRPPCKRKTSGFDSRQRLQHPWRRGERDSLTKSRSQVQSLWGAPNMARVSPNLAGWCLHQNNAGSNPVPSHYWVRGLAWIGLMPWEHQITVQIRTDPPNNGEVVQPGRSEGSPAGNTLSAGVQIPFSPH